VDNAAPPNILLSPIPSFRTGFLTINVGDLAEEGEEQSTIGYRFPHPDESGAVIHALFSNRDATVEVSCLARLVVHGSRQAWSSRSTPFLLFPSFVEGPLTCAALAWCVSRGRLQGEVAVAGTFIGEEHIYLSTGCLEPDLPDDT
jgi:hypothetical protein